MPTRATAPPNTTMGIAMVTTMTTITAMGTIMTTTTITSTTE
ncbi:hypothetical protein [Methyloceanibacter superfactus]